MNRPRLHVTLLTNIIAPYRIPVYTEIADQCDLVVIHEGTEGDRTTWAGIDTSVRGARVRRSWGIQVKVPKRFKGKTIDTRFIHISPGVLFDLLREQPDAVISNEMGFRTIMALSYCTLFRKPLWVWWGGTPHTEKSINIGRKAVRYLVSRWTKHWISYGESSTAYLASIGVPRHRITQIQNCIDERLFSTNASPKFVEENRPVLLFVGRLVAGKGIDLFLQAAARLQSEGCKFTVMLVGDGPERERLAALTERLGVSNVRFESGCKPNEMPAVYRSADVLVFPTLCDVWGLVINEAILSGLPVICSKYAGCAEEIVPREYVFDPLNPDEFVGLLRKAIVGEIECTSQSPLMTATQVGDIILSDVVDVVCADRKLAARAAAGEK